MEMSGERQIAASRADVWAALNDAEVLKACISGCQEMEKTSETAFTAKVVQKVGPVKATFTGEVELSDVVEGESYTISGKGKGGAAGAASGGAKVALAESDGGTLLTYTAEAKVTGKIAQLGSRLIDGFAKKMADDFFTKFQGQLEGEDQPEDQSVDPQGDTVKEEEEEVQARETKAGSLGDQFDEAVDAVSKVASDVASNVAKNAEEATRSAAGAIASEAEKLAGRIDKAEPNKKGFWGRLFGG
ncbi:MAG: carbon monoxide dehydrogenase subunit G [Pseudomonadota bacterium]